MPKKQDVLPFTLYHGTYYEFDYFRPLTHFGAEINAHANLNEGKWKRDPNIDINKPKIIPITLVCGNYPEIPDLNDHSVQNWMGILFQYMCTEYIADFLHALNITDKAKFITKCKQLRNDILSRDIPVPLEFDWVCEPITRNMPPNKIQQELSAETLFDIHNAENLFFQRMILYFESIGINGFKYANFTEGPGNDSYVIFRQNSIRRLDKDLPPYNEPTLQNKDFLKAQYQHFAHNHKPRMFTVPEKDKLLNELYNFYLFRFDEMASVQTKSWYIDQQ